MTRAIVAIATLLLSAVSALAQIGPGGGGGSGGITVGASISGTCPSGQVVYSNSGNVGCEPLAGGGNVSSSGSPTSGQLAFWTGASTIQGLTTLTAAAFPVLTGDVTTPGASLATTLATVNSNTGSFGSSTAIPVITLNGKGLATAASTAAVVAPAGTLSGTTLAANVVSSSLTSLGTIATLTIGVTGSTQCLHVNTSGVVSGTGSDCGSGGGGGITINSTAITSGTTGRILYDNAATVGESSGITASNTALTLTSAVTLTVGNINGSTQCVHANSSGVLSGTGSDCGSGGGGSAFTNAMNTLGAQAIVGGL